MQQFGAKTQIEISLMPKQWLNGQTNPVLSHFLHAFEKKKKTFRDVAVKKLSQETTQEDGTCFETFRRVHRISKNRKRLKLKQISH